MTRKTVRLKNGKPIAGELFSIILNNSGYFLIDLAVYADGYINCLGEISIDQLRSYLASGKLVRTLPQGNNKIFVPHVGFIHAKTSSPTGYDDEHFIKIIERAIQRLNEDDSKVRCVELFRQYLISNTDQNFEKLKDCYLTIPKGEMGLFEIGYKDPLEELMKKGHPLEKLKREYLLNDYFDGEWIEIKK